MPLWIKGVCFIAAITAFQADAQSPSQLPEETKPSSQTQPDPPKLEIPKSIEQDARAMANRATGGADASFSEAELARMVEDLSSDSYLKRKRASQDLMQAGSKAVDALVGVLDNGDLETTERAISVLQEIATKEPILPQRARLPGEKAGLSGKNGEPDKKSGGPQVETESADQPANDAWSKLSELATMGGSRGARAAVAIDEIRDVRRAKAISALTKAGALIGEMEFIIRARSELKRIVQIDERFTGDSETLQLLQWVDRIGYARLKGPAIRTEVLENIIQMPDLQTLALLKGELTMDELKTLGGLSGIRNLEFRYVPFNAEMVDKLTTLPIRVSLTLNGTAAPAERVEALRQAMPGLHVEFKQGGFLGVKCYDNFNECVINEVVRGSGAEAAGLLPGDTIVGVDDKPVKRFSDLQGFINAHLPGDQIKIRFKRHEEEKTTTAKLGKLDEPA